MFRYDLFHLPVFKQSDKHFKAQKVIVLIIVFGVSICINSGFLVCNQDGRTPLSDTETAHAYPIANIAVDGDVSDWPENVTRYSIENVYGNALENAEDFEAYFMVGHNLLSQSLYIAVVVSDDAHLIDTAQNARWDTQDTYSLYLDSQHLPSGSGVIAYQFNENWTHLHNPADSWDPAVKDATWDHVETASRHVGSKTIYECRITLYKQLYAGRSVGMDHIIIDKDADDKKGAHSHITWGKAKWKGYTSGRLGNVILMDTDEPTGTVTGQLKWEDDSIRGFPNKIKITSINNSACWIQTSVDSAGRYSAMVPSDVYKVSPAWNFYGNRGNVYKIDSKNSNVLVNVSAGQEVKAPLLEFSTLSTPDLIPEKGILHSFDREKEILLDYFIKTYQEYYEIPGVSLALIKNGRVVYHKTYGVKNAFTEEPVDENTLFEAASVTKPVFAYAVCRLMEKGIIDLDKPLYQYLPFEEIAHDERYRLITARHVLCHQTGFPNWRSNNEDGKMNIKFTPGTDYGYSGEGFEYLKRVVAHITQKDIGDVLEEEVLNPLSLRNTYFEKNEYLAKVVAHGHYDNLPTRATLPGSPGMAWSMHTEAKAFTAFILGLANRKGLKPETYDEMFKIQTIIPSEEGEEKPGWEQYFGLGIGLEKTPYGLAFGHSGNNGDFKCQFKMFTDLNMGFAVFINSNTGGELAYTALQEFLITGKEEK
ncbi:MAG: serine hydrolase [Cytophagales bacterium]|nr:serine hydrolase [Cytophagales bacterium]